MRETPLVSIIIPVYNVKPYLEEALDSVVNQTYRKLEIIVIDDGSTDGSGEICDVYAKKDNRIKVIHQENGGLSCARNAGLDCMTGEVVAFLDSDDAYYPDAIEKMLRAMITKRTDIAICRFEEHRTVRRMHDLHKVKVSGKHIGGGIYDQKKAVEECAKDKLRSYSWNKIYKSELWEDIRFPVGYICEDIDTTIRVIARSDNVFILPEILVKYRRRPGSITDHITYNNIAELMLMKNRMMRFVKDNYPDIWGKIKYYLYQDIINIYIRVYLQADNTDKNKIRTELLKKENKRLLKKCSLKIRGAFFIIKICPGFLSSLYKVYHPVWHFIWTNVKANSYL